MLRPDHFARTARPILKQIREYSAAGQSQKRLVALHQLGQLLVKETGKRASYGARSVEAAAKAIQWPVGAVFRARKLAIVYTKQELLRLSRLAPQATATHFVKIAGIPKQKKRRTLARLLGRHRWTSARLQKEIRTRLGRRRQGGRPPKDRLPLPLVRELEERIEAVRRTWNSGAPAVAKQRASAEPKSLRRAVQTLKKAVKRLAAELGIRRSRRGG